MAKMILKICQFRLFIPLRKSFGLRMLCVNFDWNWPSFSGEEDVNVKSLRHKDNDDDGQNTTRKAHLDLLALVI